MLLYIKYSFINLLFKVLAAFCQVFNHIKIIYNIWSSPTCKREVARTRFGHMLRQECLVSIDKAQKITWTKVRNPEKVRKWLFLEEEDSSHVECKYKIISRLIFIKLQWESF